MIQHSRRIRAEDFESQWYKNRASELCIPTQTMRRKDWEFAIVCQIIKEQFHARPLEFTEDVIPETDADGPEFFEPPFKAIGFGVGKDPIPAWLARRGWGVIASDWPDEAEDKWTDQSSACHEDLNFKPLEGLDEEEATKAKQLITWDDIDMRRLPATGKTEKAICLYEGQFDLVWSCGSLEHIGGRDAGFEFIHKAMAYLKPGGLAIHTTEFNYKAKSAIGTVDSNDLCLYTWDDLHRLFNDLTEQDNQLWPLDLRQGERPEDRMVDEPPYENPIHINIRIEGRWETTSVCLVARRLVERDSDYRF